MPDPADEIPEDGITTKEITGEASAHSSKSTAEKNACKLLSLSLSAPISVFL
jgi:hypothetical protein